MSLLKTLELRSFRGMTDLTFREMTSVTVLVGANNAGKTSVLEAAALALWAPDPGQWVQFRWLEPGSGFFAGGRALVAVSGGTSDSS